jgi:hypothetical protein
MARKTGGKTKKPFKGAAPLFKKGNKRGKRRVR